MYSGYAFGLCLKIPTPIPTLPFINVIQWNHQCSNNVSGSNTFFFLQKHFEFDVLYTWYRFRESKTWTDNNDENIICTLQVLNVCSTNAKDNKKTNVRVLLPLAHLSRRLACYIGTARRGRLFFGGLSGVNFSTFIIYVIFDFSETTERNFMKLQKKQVRMVIYQVCGFFWPLRVITAWWMFTKLGIRYSWFSTGDNVLALCRYVPIYNKQTNKTRQRQHK